MKVFVSYRRGDSGYVAHTLSEKIAERFGRNKVFFDIDNIPLGVDFREHIDKAVAQCDILIAIIGDEWLTVTNERGERRIEDESDFVRLEIEAAIKRKIPLIPVLVDNATMPSADKLPASIRELVFRNGAEIRAGRDLRRHVERLVRGLEVFLRPGKGSGDEVPEETPEAVEPPAPEAATGPDDDTSAPITAELIRRLLGDFTDEYLHVAPGLPLDKLAKAIGKYAPDLQTQDVLLLYDNTVFGSAKDGFLLTADTLYWHNMWCEPMSVPLGEIDDVVVGGAELLVDGEDVQMQMGGDQKELRKVMKDLLRVLAHRAKS